MHAGWRATGRRVGVLVELPEQYNRVLTPLALCDETVTSKHLGFLVNSETRHTEGANNQIWAFLLTALLGFLVNSETRHRGSEQPSLGKAGEL